MPLFEGQSCLAPAGLELSELLGLEPERQEKQQHLYGDIGCSMESSRPLSSMSTSAGGPTPGLEDLTGQWQHSSFLEGCSPTISPTSAAEDDLPMMVRPSSRYGCGSAGSSSPAACGTAANPVLCSNLLSTGASANGINCGAVSSGCGSIGSSTDLLASAPDPAAMCCHSTGNILGGWLSEGLGFGGAAISCGSGLAFDGGNLSHAALALRSLGQVHASQASQAMPLGGDGRLDGPPHGTSSCAGGAGCSRGAKGGGTATTHSTGGGRGNSVGAGGRGRKERRGGRGSQASRAGENNGPRDVQHLTKAIVVQMSKTQAGSKLLQRKLLKGHPTVIQDIIEGLETELPDIMCDMYGNYLCSAAFQACSVSQRLRMLGSASRHLHTVATDRWGTHSLQALISLVCTTEELNVLVPALQEHLVELSCDANGAHVIQRALVSLGAPCPDEILYEVASGIRSVACNQHGLSIVKRCISHSRPGAGQQQLLKELAQHSLDLVQDSHGNYAVQHALEEWGKEACFSVMEALKSHLVKLSCQKFSSNVIEHLMRAAPEEVQQAIMEELTSPEQAQALQSSVYGHFIVKQLMQNARPEQRQVLEHMFLRGSTGPRRCGPRGRRGISGTKGASSPDGGVTNR